jgi:hypothetical protein
MIDDNIETNDNAPTAKVLPFNKVTSKITPSNQNTPDPAIVKLFEDYLEKAKAGEISFIAVACVDAVGIAYSTWEPGEMNPRLVTQALGSVAYMAARINASAVDGSVYHDEIPPDDLRNA